MGSGVYRPRPKGAAMSDALAEARIALARLTQIAILRGAGLVILLATLAVAVALVSYSSGDPSLNNATGRAPDNLLGPLGATAADVLLEAFGIAAFAFIAPLAVWGTRAMMGRGMKHAVWRAIAWPLGTAFVAAGLGLLPKPPSLPAGAGGWIGIAATHLSNYAGQTYGQHWIGTALPLLLLIAGLPLAFIATGLRFSRVLRHVGTGAAAAYWLGSKVKLPKASSLRRAEPAFDYDDEDDLEPDAHIEDDDSVGYALETAPEPIAATR